MKLGWYIRRLRRMSAAELAARAQVAARQRWWSKPGRRPDGLKTLKSGPRAAAAVLPRAAAPAGTPAAAAAIAAADRLMAGQWPVFHLRHAPVAEVPEWFRDPLTGTVAPRDSYAFKVPYRDESKVGNIKFVWELSRHQATTLLACAWWLTGDDAYAERAARHLQGWWRDNPFLAGVHWTSAIEVGLRLLSWTWIRALLADWPGVRALFDDNPAFQRQLYHHQLYARVFHSRGSSANNHLVAELAGLSASSVAFPWFAESAGWAEWSRARLVQQASVQTHADGFNREQASEYHLFVLEMFLAAALPARLAGRPLPAAFDDTLRRMADALAAGLDAAGRPPRFGDGDEGRGVLLDPPDVHPTGILLDACAALYGPAPWWPASHGSVFGHAARLAAGTTAKPRDIPRPDSFPGTGMTILRCGNSADEIWLRCDAGPHGFLSIAAHGHADALSVELRCGGIDVLADPGTYCYHGEPEWRALFKGTPGHNTLTIDGVDQAVNGGPFMWLTHPVSTVVAATAAADAPLQSWEASHDGYRRLPDPVTHRRRVQLDRDAHRVTVDDWIEAGAEHDVLLAWHFGPEVSVSLDGSRARLSWPGGGGDMELPGALAWRIHRGETAPPLGWYSHGFGHKEPSAMLAGSGRLAGGASLSTRITVSSPDRSAEAESQCSSVPVAS
jgi:hypothetical protein